jgi:transcription elongation GreA/GreB family factor
MKDLTQQIERGELDGIEDAWLARLAEAPGDLAFFASTARSLHEHGAEEQAGFLLQMLDEQLREEGRWRERLELLRRAGGLLAADPPALHGEIVRSLEAAHPGHSALRPLAEKVGLFRAIEDVPKLWEKVEKLLDLLRVDRGTPVLLEGKGAGRVADINLQLDSFRVELGDGSTVSVGFAAARKVLRPLPPGHVLRRALEEPEALARLKEQQPAELARIALESYAEPLTAGELRQALLGIVGDKEWTGFWNQVRRHPQLLALPGARQRYRWAESAGAALSTLRERFDAADLREKLDLLRAHGARDPDLRQAMVEELLRQAASARAEEAFEIAVALDRAGFELPPEGTGAVAILSRLDDPLRFALALPDRTLREEVYRRLPGLRADWPEVFEAAFAREEDPRLLDLLATELRAAAPARLDAAVGDLISQPRRNPAGFTWLAERAAEDESLLRRAPLRLLQQILQGASDSSFGPARRRLTKLAESGGTLPRLLPLIEPEHAPLVEEALGRASGLEEFQRTLLRNALHLRYPELRQAHEVPLYATPEAIGAKREELRQLLEVDIPANRRAIETARELGDLRENFEYKSARQRHEYLSARASTLHRDLGRARPVDAATVDPASVRVGTRVLLQGPAGDRAFTILGPWDSRPEEGVLSNETELAHRLLGKEVGDEVEIDGQPCRVVGIEPFR